MTWSIALSAIFAGIVAIGASVCVEKFGGRLGGLLGSIPTTIVPASVGFWLSAETPAVAQAALYAVPPGMMVTALFLYSWRVLPSKLPQRSLGSTLGLMTASSLAIWGAAATAMVLAMGVEGLSVLAVGVSCFGIQVIFGTWACMKNPPAPKGAKPVAPMVLVARGLLAAAAIGVSVWLAELGIPLVAGVASVFPAIFLTTMLAVWLSQGQAVQAGAVGPLMLGSSSVSAYALAAAWLMGPLGWGLGVVVAWVVSVALISIPAWWWLGRRDE
jgi:hypothetical protein